MDSCSGLGHSLFKNCVKVGGNGVGGVSSPHGTTDMDFLQIPDKVSH